MSDLHATVVRGRLTEWHELVVREAMGQVNHQMSNLWQAV
jgi:hypothetical protein